ncbi:MAG: NAD(P)H-dependent glycerol-3-phosphate dehydrogenase [Wolbachia endosymbiont of Fragariocoptes setiger]|nr:NAD(P)H-dependent glycerol-3-phosphate dehydrogenase [Wolbachia endosymbiont of Fragariocoptes setiger]
MTISILGAGAWGTAIAIALSSKKNITLWMRSNSTFEHITKKKINHRLPECSIPPNVFCTSNIEDILSSTPLILAVPTQSLREICTQLAQYRLKSDIPIIITCKGIEKFTLMLPSEIIKEILPKNPVAVFSGPSFATEVARKQPYSMTLACKNESLGQKLMLQLQHDNVKLHFSKDILGVQVCGALKNVFAIACGIILGKELGFNAHASLIVKSINEIKTLYLAKVHNHNIDILLGPSCLGDLILTCTSSRSRNLSFGIKVGKSDENIKQNLQEGFSVIEGISTAQSTFNLARELKIKMPICEAVYKILYQNVSLEDTISSLIL